MTGWIGGIQDAIDYIENHLDDQLKIEEISRIAGLSPFYFQRLFGALCGMSVGEYIRARRMTVAAWELQTGDQKIIDLAMTYGYDSPDAFSRAFRKFHGVNPSKAKDPGRSLRSLTPITLQLKLEGSYMLDYRIVEKAPFTIVGMKRPFKTDRCYQEIPVFWQEWAQMTTSIKGMFGACLDVDGTTIDYYIADLYEPWHDVPENCETVTIPGSLWAEFTCRGPLPESLQRVNTEVWTQWLPNLKGYELAGNFNLEVYTPKAADPEDTISYIWIPVRPIP